MIFDILAIPFTLRQIDMGLRYSALCNKGCFGDKNFRVGNKTFREDKRTNNLYDKRAKIAYYQILHNGVQRHK